MEMSIESSMGCCALHTSYVVNLFILLSCCSFILWGIGVVPNEIMSPYIYMSYAWLNNTPFYFPLSAYITKSDSSFVISIQNAAKFAQIFQIGKQKQLLEILYIQMSQVAYACCWTFLSMKMHGIWTMGRFVLLDGHCSALASYCTALVLQK